MQKSIIFDLDGTLADTSLDLIAAANACFVARGMSAPLDPVADVLTAFGGGRAMLRLGYERLHGGDRGADEDAVEADYPRLLEYYAAHIDTHTRLYPGVERALDDALASGWALGICTNKPAALAEELVTRLGVRDRFGALLGADSLPIRKPNPEHLFATIKEIGSTAQRSMLVGDTITDAKTARAAAVPLILVGFGPEGPGISRLGADAILSHYDKLLEIAGALLRS